MEKKSRKSRWPVLVPGIVALAMLANYALIILQYRSFASLSAFAFELLWVTVSVVFALVGTLIISRNRRHTIGWLLMILPIMTSTSAFLDYIYRPQLTQTPISTGVLIYLWFNSWSWWFLIASLILIFLLYPTGQLLSRKWRWVMVALATGFVIFLFAATFGQYIEEVDGGLTAPNPIGFLPQELQGVFLGLMGVFLLGSAAASLASIFVRYRQAQSTERAQMRWLFIACAFFVLNYIPAFALQNYNDTALGSLLFILSIVAIPVAIGIAILRYRLWDIDVVINRSIVYGVLTTVLAALFAGTAAGLAQLAKAAFGEDMQQAAAAVAAIIVANLFTPIRGWVESTINRWLFPENIDLAKGLVEIQPNMWAWMGLPRILQASLDHLEAIYGNKIAAIYLRDPAGTLQPAAARGVDLKELTPYQLEAADLERLLREQGIVSDQGQRFQITTPISLNRRKGKELVGVLRLGQRKQGRSFSGGDLKTLAAFGAKLAEPVYALAEQKAARKR